MKLSKQNNSLDAFLLVFVRALTILVNMLSTAILSRNLSLDNYGTYASANLVISSFTNITQLGMMDAVNYYYNKNTDRRDSINTIFLIQICVGIFSAGVILGTQREIVSYFANPGFVGLFGYLALRPMLGNLHSSMLVLQTAIGKARGVAIRNAALALAKLATVVVASFITKDIATIFAAHLIFDIISLVYFYHVFQKESFLINPFAAKPRLIMPILRFAVPMGIYVMTNSLSRDLDKLVISYFENTETIAVYSNCAALLPFDIVSSAVLTVIVPVLTRLIQSGEYERSTKLLQGYFRVGMITTVLFAGICMICADEVILVLYGEKYLEGKPIFMLYTLVDVAKIASLHLVLTAKGRTKTLMGLSLAVLACNAVLNVLFYQLFGLLGPAIATVMITLGTTICLLLLSAGILQTKLSSLFGGSNAINILLRLFAALSIGVVLQAIMNMFELHYLIVLAVCGLTVCSSALLLCRKDLQAAFHSLNQERNGQDLDVV